MTNEFGGGWMNATASQYQVTTTRITGTLGVITRLLKADARRWWVQFCPATGAGTMSPFVPGGWPAAGGPAAFNSLPQRYNWRDAPAALAGEWWGVDNANTGWVITECLYVGDDEPTEGG